MTINDTSDLKKTYRSINVHKYQNTQLIKKNELNIYLYMQIEKNIIKNMICIKYLVLNNSLNYLPLKPIEIIEDNSKILNKISIKINKLTTLNIIILDKLINTSIFDYKCRFTFINFNTEIMKQFFNFNDLRYKICNVTHKIQQLNTKQIEEELLCNLINNISINL